MKNNIKIILITIITIIGFTLLAADSPDMDVFIITKIAGITILSMMVIGLAITTDIFKDDE